MRWGDNLTFEFVKLYLKNECLWNTDHPGYKVNNERVKAYLDIISEFKSLSGRTMTIPEIKVKIKNLRTTYIQQVHKIFKKSSPDEIYEPSLVWFHEMDRCLKYVPSNGNRTFTCDDEAQDKVDTSSQVWVELDSQDTKTENSNPDPLNSHSNEEYLISDQLEAIRMKTTHRNSSKKIKKKKFKRRSSSTSFMSDSLKEYKDEKEDEFDIYGKFIASQLRKMNIQKALRLQLEIQSLVSEARISDL